ncbi:MAG: hypothetical protein HYX62_08980 [Gammaproteobacteria bacterium]|nr:hypothetical protein [Gammaproteobacteria bacterium]
MGLFDHIAGEAIGKLTGQGSGQSSLLDGVMDMLNNNQAGGIGGLVQSFKDKGLGDIVSSWIGTGSNLPISPEQIQQALGAELKCFCNTLGSPQGFREVLLKPGAGFRGLSVRCARCQNPPALAGGRSVRGSAA